MVVVISVKRFLETKLKQVSFYSLFWFLEREIFDIWMNFVSKRKIREIHINNYLPFNNWANVWNHKAHIKLLSKLISRRFNSINPTIILFPVNFCLLSFYSIYCIWFVNWLNFGWHSLHDHLFAILWKWVFFFGVWTVESGQHRQATLQHLLGFRWVWGKLGVGGLDSRSSL